MQDIYPLATQRPVPYAGEAGLMRGPIGWILHVVVGDGSPWRTFTEAVPPNRRFSHLWVSKRGTVEQYAPLGSKSWAQAAGNGWYWSVETEGVPGEPLTDSQLNALAAWHVWCGAPDMLAEAPGQPGIGTHYMGGAAWGRHSCPGPIRAAQRTEILRRAAALRHPTNLEDDVTPDDIERIAQRTAELVTGLGARNPVLVDAGTGSGRLPDGRAIDALPTVVGEIQHEQREQRALLDRVTATLARIDATLAAHT